MMLIRAICDAVVIVGALRASMPYELQRCLLCAARCYVAYASARTRGCADDVAA